MSVLGKHVRLKSANQVGRWMCVNTRGRAMTLVDVIWCNHERMPTCVRHLILIIAGSILIALTAQVRIPLPHTPVPITGQTFGVILIGFALGALRGAMTTAVYVFEGVIGLPVFAGGAGGWLALCGPTGGYLLGFIAGAWVAGFLAERGWDRCFHTMLLAALLSTAVIYIPGLIWLAAFVGWKHVWFTGLLPFIPGDIIKALLATIVLPTAWRMASRGANHV